MDTQQIQVSEPGESPAITKIEVWEAEGQGEVR